MRLEHVEPSFGEVGAGFRCGGGRAWVEEGSSSRQGARDPEEIPNRLLGWAQAG
jgi:hypothetical protein